MTENIYSQRLLLFIEKKGWSKSALGRVLGIKRQNIGRYFTGEADPKKIVINLIPHGLNLDWFMTGEGEMYVVKEGAKRAREDAEPGARAGATQTEAETNAGAAQTGQKRESPAGCTPSAANPHAEPAQTQPQPGQTQTQRTSQSSSQGHSQNTNQSTSQRTGQGTDQGTSHNNDQRTGQSTSQGHSQDTNQSTSQRTGQGTSQDTNQSTSHNNDQDTQERLSSNHYSLSSNQSGLSSNQSDHQGTSQQNQPLNACSTPHQQPVNDRSTPEQQQPFNANAAAQSIKTAPFFYEAIGRRLAVREESIEEGDILVIDPVIPAAEGDLILRSSTEGPEIVKYQPGEKNIKGVVVSLNRQYPAINRQ